MRGDDDAVAQGQIAEGEGLQERIQKLLEENTELKKQVSDAEQKAMTAEADSIVNQAEDINGLRVLILKLKDKENGGLKSYAETLRNKISESIVLIANETNGTVTFVCAASKEAIAKGKKAGDIVKAAAQVCGGNGGGRPDMAQAGGKDVAKIDDALKAAKTKISE